MEIREGLNVSRISPSFEDTSLTLVQVMDMVFPWKKIIPLQYHRRSIMASQIMDKVIFYSATIFQDNNKKTQQSLNYPLFVLGIRQWIVDSTHNNMIELIAMELPSCGLTFPTKIFCRDASGFETGCPSGV